VHWCTAPKPGTFGARGRDGRLLQSQMIVEIEKVRDKLTNKLLDIEAKRKTASAAFNYFLNFEAAEQAAKLRRPFLLLLEEEEGMRQRIMEERGEEVPGTPTSVSSSTYFDRQDTATEGGTSHSASRRPRPGRQCDQRLSTWSKQICSALSAPRAHRRTRRGLRYTNRTQ